MEELSIEQLAELVQKCRERKVELGQQIQQQRERLAALEEVAAQQRRDSVAYATLDSVSKAAFDAKKDLEATLRARIAHQSIIDKALSEVSSVEAALRQATALHTEKVRAERHRINTASAKLLAADYDTLKGQAIDALAAFYVAHSAKEGSHVGALDLSALVRMAVEGETGAVTSAAKQKRASLEASVQ
jgi:hypothetical protein